MTKGLPRWWPSYFKSRKIWTTFGARLLASQIVSLLIYLSLMHVSPKLFSDPVPVLGQQDYLNEIISHWQLPRLVVVSMYHPYLFGGRVETVLQDGSLPSYSSAGGESLSRASLRWESRRLASLSNVSANRSGYRSFVSTQR